MLGLPLVVALLAAAPVPVPAVSPWNGSWTIDLARSSAIAKQGAADAYRFTLTPDGDPPRKGNPRADARSGARRAAHTAV